MWYHDPAGSGCGIMIQQEWVWYSNSEWVWYSNSEWVVLMGPGCGPIMQCGVTCTKPKKRRPQLKLRWSRKLESSSVHAWAYKLNQG